jgi:hypothetical protein
LSPNCVRYFTTACNCGHSLEIIIVHQERCPFFYSSAYYFHLFVKAYQQGTHRATKRTYNYPKSIIHLFGQDIA